MKPWQSIRCLVRLCAALSLAACSGDDLSVEIPGPTPARTLELDFPPGEAVQRTLPFRISGGRPPYVSRIENCPDWVTLFPDQGILAGTAPASDSGRTFFCTYVVTDSATLTDPETRSFGLRLVVGSPEALFLDFSPAQALTIGARDSVTLPAASGGVPPHAYSFDCAGGTLPSGMSFAPATRVFSGTPDAPFRDSCTYSVTDSSQPAVTVSRTFVVTSAPERELALPEVRDQALLIGDWYSDTLPDASGGVPPHTYSFACAGGALPPGMSFVPATRVFSGTPDAPFQDSCTYSVTDSSQPAEADFRTVVVTSAPDGELALLSEVPAQALTIGDSYSEALPRASGGVPPYTYRFACAGGALPSGTSFSPATRVFSGTPDAPFQDSCTYSVTDSSQPAETDFRTIVVTSAPADMLALPEEVPVPPLTIGAWYSETFPGASGGVPPYAYAFACAGGDLPSGMSFAPATRVFSGTPAAGFRDTCAYSVTDSSRPAETVYRAIEVISTEGEEGLSLAEVVVGFPGDNPEDNSVRLDEYRRAQVTFAAATGGLAPYTYEIAGCTLPGGLHFSSASRTLSGTPLETYRGANCTYRVTDSASVSVSRDFELVVDPLEGGPWRFRTRTVDDPGGPCALRVPGHRTPVAILPHAHGGEVGEDEYELVDLPDDDDSLTFHRATRQLDYTHQSADPILGTPNTYRYMVFGEGDDRDDPSDADDALCLDVRYNPGPEASCPAVPSLDLEPHHFLHIQVQVRDDAYWDETTEEYRCPDLAARAPRQSGAQGVSNPVHTALGPVHARRAANAAHSAVRDRVRGWSPGSSRGLAVSPAVDFASLSGLADGFDYTGSSQSLSAGAELGAGSWQAGAVAAFTRTDLRYRAGADLAGLGYLAGEHTTEILSVHPFAAWHAPAGGHLWASLGAGLGDLRHRDDPGFASRSRSDVRLRAYAAGASVPLARLLSGALDAEAGIEAFAFEIDGGGQISASLPTLRGRDWRAGLAWSAPVRGAPFVSLAWKRLTGDGPEGTQVEARGSVSVAGILDPRLTLTGNAEASFGLGDYEHDAWRLGGGIRFAPDGLGRGFGLDIDTRLMSLAEGRSAGIGVRGEAGYGLWGGTVLGTVRPYVGMIRYPGEGFVRRAVGIDLRDTAASTVKAEVHDRARDLPPALRLVLRRRF